jgi:hypothetical protein
MSLLGRAERVSPHAQRLFIALIDGMLATGAPPDLAALADAVGPPSERVEQLLGELAQADWLARDAGGRLSAVYPFALTRTGIDVTLGDFRLPVMCAIDALGVAPMLNRRVVAHARCAQCERAIDIHVDPTGIARRRPRSTVVIRRLTRGPAHAARCSATRFACSPAHADEWRTAHGGPDDVMQSLETAFIEAREIFGDTYRN